MTWLALLWHTACHRLLLAAHDNLIATARGAGPDSLHVARCIIYHADHIKEARTKLRL